MDGGVVNLVATQFTLDREHASRVVFSGEPGLDPTLDIVLQSPDLRAAIQAWPWAVATCQTA